MSRQLSVSFPIPVVPTFAPTADGLRLLSFDGGGIRGLSSLIILQEVMRRLQAEEGLTQMPLPWQYFDMITGTSGGGLIALMLGRLRMSVGEAIENYTALAQFVFSERKPRWKEGMFKASRLEEFVKKMVAKHSESTNENTSLLDGRPDACKVFVCAMRAETMRAVEPVHFRTYDTLRNPGPSCSIWEAARATTAEALFFKRITIEGDDYIGGGGGCNNPTARILEEARHIFRGRAIATVLSIGTGQSATISLPSPGVDQNLLKTKVANLLKEVAMECESTANNMSNKFEHYADVYFRFNVDQGLQDIEPEAWKKMRLVSPHTKQYLQLYDNSDRADRVARSIKARRQAYGPGSTAQ